MPKEEKSKIISPAERVLEVEKVPEVPEKAPKIEIPEVAEAPKEAPLKAPPAPPVTLPKVEVRDPVLAQIENILEEDLKEVYAGLTPELKPQFKAKGEEAAKTIRDMIDRAKLKARKVLKLIKSWLKMVPGINRFFLEQEAAIKAQKIMEIAAKDSAKQK